MTRKGHATKQPSSHARAIKQRNKSGVISEEELRFCEAYSRHRNLSRAYRETWPDTPYVQCASAAFRLYQMPRIKQALDDIAAEVKERLVVSEETITLELAKLAFLNISRFIVIKPDGTAYTDLSLLEPEDYAAISEIKSEVYLDGAREVKSCTIKLAPKTPALELLGNKLRMWSNKVELSTGVDIGERIRVARAKRRMIDVTPGVDDA